MSKKQGDSVKGVVKKERKKEQNQVDVRRRK